MPSTSKGLSKEYITQSGQSLLAISPVYYNTIAQRLNDIMHLYHSFSIQIDEFLTTYGLVKLPVRPDGHCLLHAWEIATGTKFDIIKENIRNEYKSNRQYQQSTISSAELNQYLNNNKYDLPSVDAVVEMLCNAFNVTVFIIDSTNVQTTDTWKFSPVSQNIDLRNTVFLLKCRKHYDALVCNNSVEL